MTRLVVDERPTLFEKLGERKMHGFFQTTAIGLVFSLIAFVTTTNADLVTIDFDGFASTPNFAGGTEDGFVIENVSGRTAVSSRFLGSYSGANSIHHRARNGPGISVFEIAHSLGDSFQLQSFRAGSYFDSLGPFTVSGFLGGTLLGSETYTPTPDNYVLLTAPSLQGVQIDRIVFNLGSSANGPIHIDDIILVTVPEPTAALVGFGIAATLLIRRRRNP